MNLKVKSSGYSGIDNYLVDVELDIRNGIPSFYIIGLGDTSVSESRERVRIALKNLDITLSQKKILVNLSPAFKKKEGSHYDLAIAAGVLIGLEKIRDNENILENYIFLGELSLNGKVKGVKGGIGAAILAKELGYKGVILPYDNVEEASLIPGVEVLGIESVGELLELFESYTEYKNKSIIKVNEILLNKKKNFYSKKLDIDFSDVKGQKLAKRALEIAVAGGHNILMIGSPGSGKSMLAKRVESIMPDIGIEETIECTKIYSIAGELNEENPFIKASPFRMPHHTGTIASVIGGGKVIKPGEVTLAHNGVLFLDELSEFSKEVLEGLRQPLEDKKVYISRMGYKIELPANFMLISSSNPCNCGMLYEGASKCKCTASEINRYQRKLSGPILDRIDLVVEIKKISEEDLLNKTDEESSKLIKKRIEDVRKIQKNRFAHSKTKLNSEMNLKEIEKYCKLDNREEIFVKTVINTFELTARGFHKLLKVARTIADLENREKIEKKHILEAINFRRKK